MGTGWAHYRGIAGDTIPHAHYPLQAIFTHNRPIDINIGGADIRTRTGDIALVPSDKLHQLMPTADQVDIFYVEPTLASPDLQTLKSVTEWRDYLCCATPQISDEKLVAALGAVDQRLEGKVSLQTVANQVGMSKSSFTQRFRAATGLPLRRYVLWRRLYLAVHSVSDGMSLTEAAHIAGFSDSAHFSRTMRETFGVSPSKGMLNIKMSVLPNGQCLR